MLTTPENLFPELSMFREQLRLTEEPVFVPVRPRRGSIPDNCTKDVRKQVAEHGGMEVLGWLIWCWPGISAEATFHSVWRATDGTLVDVSRKTDGEKRILFIPDPTLAYTGERIDTVRIRLRSHPLVQAFIRAGDAFDSEFVAQYGRRHRGKVILRGRLLELHEEKAELTLRLLNLAMAAGNEPKGTRELAAC